MAIPSTLSILNSPEWSSPKPHDYRTFEYVAAAAADDDDVQYIKYYKGGAGGTLVATLTLSYLNGTNNIGTMALTVP
jgi:hypothetical protein